jgi:hypothetical protein
VAIFWAFLFTGISWLWYNVIGCVVVVGTALAITYLAPANGASAESARERTPEPG